MMSINLSHIDILNNKGSDYCCIINGIRKSEAMKLLQSIDMLEKRGKLQKKQIQRVIYKNL